MVANVYIPSTGLRQEDCLFKTSPRHAARPCLTKPMRVRDRERMKVGKGEERGGGALAVGKKVLTHVPGSGSLRLLKVVQFPWLSHSFLQPRHTELPMRTAGRVSSGHRARQHKLSAWWESKHQPRNRTPRKSRLPESPRTKAVRADSHPTACTPPPSYGLLTPPMSHPLSASFGRSPGLD